jgi:hypothetical protein
MRRALDWTVVSLSALALYLGRTFAHPDLASAPADPALRAEVVVATPPGASPFAYILEDGTEVPLPASGPLDEAPSVDAGRPQTALFSWSTPVRSATSDAPSSR